MEETYLSVVPGADGLALYPWWRAPQCAPRSPPFPFLGPMESDAHTSPLQAESTWRLPSTQHVTVQKAKYWAEAWTHAPGEVKRYKQGEHHGGPSGSCMERGPVLEVAEPAITLQATRGMLKNQGGALKPCPTFIEAFFPGRNTFWRIQ